MADDKPDDTLAAALARFQAKLPRIVKDETAQVQGKTKDGTPYSYSYSYADLADLSAVALPLLGGEGLSFTARPTLTEEGRFVLAYSLLHASGQSRDGMYPLPADVPIQTQGSAITYARRYSLCAVTGLAPDEEDDDGQAATQAPPTQSENRQRSAYDDPPGTRPAGKEAADNRRKALYAKAGEAGIDTKTKDADGRTELHRGAAVVLGHQVDHISALSVREHQMVMDALKKRIANGEGQGQAGETGSETQNDQGTKGPGVEEGSG